MKTLRFKWKMCMSSKARTSSFVYLNAWVCLSSNLPRCLLILWILKMFIQPISQIIYVNYHVISNSCSCKRLNLSRTHFNRSLTDCMFIICPSSNNAHEDEDCLKPTWRLLEAILKSPWLRCDKRTKTHPLKTNDC